MVLAQDRTWQVLCDRFARATPPVYIPPVPLDGSWEATFVYVCASRCNALPPTQGDLAGAEVPNTHKITVTARVRPKR